MPAAVDAGRRRCEPVVMSPSTNGISAAWTEPATDFSTKAFQRALGASMPETRLAMSW